MSEVGQSGVVVSDECQCSLLAGTRLVLATAVAVGGPEAASELAIRTDSWFLFTEAKARCHSVPHPSSFHPCVAKSWSHDTTIESKRDTIDYLISRDLRVTAYALPFNFY